MAEQQFALFQLDEAWKEHWQGMPEFVQDDIEPCRSLIVHFETQDDVKAFEQLVGQRLLSTAKWIWFPFKARADFTAMGWVDES